MLDRIDNLFGNVKYMRREQADLLEQFIIEHRLRNLLELGTYHGKGTAYMAAILEARGDSGKITTLDRNDCMKLDPNISYMLEKLELSHRVDIQLHPRTFSITLMKFLEDGLKSSFDFCYQDGGHTWDGTGFTFFLVDQLLKPGGWIIFDDLDWSRVGSEHTHNRKIFDGYDEEEMQMKPVRKVWELLVPALGYINRRETEWGWGIARKPPQWHRG